MEIFEKSSFEKILPAAGMQRWQGWSAESRPRVIPAGFSDNAVLYVIELWIARQALPGFLFRFLSDSSEPHLLSLYCQTWWPG
jgi:hypothetical protein